MNGSVRAVCAAGVAALTGTALVVCPSVLPAKAEVSRPVVHTASVTAFTPPAEPPSADELKSALTLVGQLAQPADRSRTRVPVEVLEDPAAFNAASTVIDDVYSVTRYWANYVALELGPWLLGWVPLGYLISDQIYIWYPNAVLPTVDSFVYDFLDPVVNDALDPAVWIDGINAVIRTAANGIANGITDEINYVVSLGWFPIPLPPLPNPPLPRVASVSTAAVAAAVTTEVDETLTDTADETAGEAVTEPAEPVSLEPATPEVPAEADEADTETEPEAEPSAEPVEDAEPEDVAETTEETTEESAEEEAETVVDEDLAADDSSDGEQDENEGAEQEPGRSAETPGVDKGADNESTNKGGDKGTDKADAGGATGSDD